MEKQITPLVHKKRRNYVEIQNQILPRNKENKQHKKFKIRWYHETNKTNNVESLKSDVTTQKQNKQHRKLKIKS